MAVNQEAPGTQGKCAGAYHQIHHEGSKYLLNRSEYRVYSLLMEGGKFATFEISDRLHIPDPRSVIRYLRKMGVAVSDMWCKGEFGVKFKRYFIRKGGAQ